MQIESERERRRKCILASTQSCNVAEEFSPLRGSMSITIVPPEIPPPQQQQLSLAVCSSERIPLTQNAQNVQYTGDEQNVQNEQNVLNELNVQNEQNLQDMEDVHNVQDLEDVQNVQNEHSKQNVENVQDMTGVQNVQNVEKILHPLENTESSPDIMRPFEDLPIESR